MKTELVQRFRIGEVSKITGFPVETIRYFEEIKLIEPYQDTYNKYRYFTILDIEKIMDYKQFRNMGYSAKDAVAMTKMEHVDQIQEKLRERARECRQQSRYYQMLEVKLQHYANVIQDITLHHSYFMYTDSPGFYWLENKRLKDDWLTFENDKQVKEAEMNLMDYYAFIEDGFRFELDEISEHRKPVLEGGIFLKKMWADQLDIPYVSYMDYLPSTPCIYTVIKSAGHPLIFEDFKPLAEFLEKNNLKADEPLIAVVLVTLPENHKSMRYFEVWQPYKSLE